MEPYTVGRTGLSTGRKGHARLQQSLEACVQNLENLKKQAKFLVRWHREGNYSVGGRIRQLPRYRSVTDVEALAMKFSLGEAQEIIALEAGFPSWAALKAGSQTGQKEPQAGSSDPVLTRAMPVLLVSDVERSARFFEKKLGFTIDFLHGLPPFYGSVSRGNARMHLRFVHGPVISAVLREREKDVLSAFIEVDNVKRLFAEYKEAGATFAHPLKKQPWGASAFTVIDPDGNCICFAG